MTERIKIERDLSQFVEQTRKTYEKILAEAQEDEKVIGFVLGGGRGKGFSTEHSDYDISFIVSDADRDEYVERYQKRYYSTEAIDIHVFSLSEFKAYAAWGTPDHVHAYNFTHLKPQIDRTGEIQRIIEEKGRLPESEVRKYTADQLDGFINSYYRAIKNGRDGSAFASHLDGSESLPFLIGALYGLEGRLKPYNKYLEWEFKNHPLKDFPYEGQEFLEKMRLVLATGDMEVLKDIYRVMEKLFIERGHEETVHGWDGYYLG